MRDATRMNMGGGGQRCGEELRARDGTAVSFDGDQGQGVCIIFGPRPVDRRATAGGLWWTRPVTPEEIDEVVGIIAKENLPVEEIVIGGLERYPIFLDGWPRWLAHWCGRKVVRRIIVETAGLCERERRRLVAATKRRLNWAHRRDPITRAVDTIMQLMDGRYR